MAAHAGSYEDFFLAIERDDPRGVSRLLQHGFDADSRNPMGQTALFVAMREQSLRAADALMAGRPDVNALNAGGESALMMAALKGEVAWCRRLIELGAEVNKTGWTPLHYAASGSSVEAVRLLLDRGAVVDAESPNGTTPLMMAARYGNPDSVDLLMQRGADPRRRNALGFTAADFARQEDRGMLAARLDKLMR